MMGWLREHFSPGHLVDDQLIDGEELEFDEAPDLVLFLASRLDFFAIIAISIFVVAKADSEAVTLVGQLGILGCILWLVVLLLQRYFTRYVITNLRILRLSGVLRRDYEWIAWNRVTDVSVHRSVVDRLFSTATIRIQSANEHSGFKAMTDIPNPDYFAAQIAELVNARRSQSGFR